MRKKIIIGLTSVALMALIFGMIMRKVSIPLPENIQMHDPTAHDMKRGRELLEKMLIAHGGRSQWKQFKVIEAVAAHNIFAPYRWKFGYYPHYPQQLKMTTLLGTDNGRFEFLDGPEQGLQWGLQNWACYKIEPGEEPVFEQDFGVFFYVATGNYFLLLPFRVQEANTVALMGEKEWEGKIYDLVMATWDGFEPKKTIDQYILWISRDTARLDYMTFSVRDQGSFVVATISYMNYRNVEGLLLPFEFRIVFGDEPDDWPRLHHLHVDSIKLYKTADKQFFFPRPNLSYVKPTKW
ncbi:hypothetical protein IH879_20605 [candidate division KSB1 bacterium]|nr:hypothetical protein [candidate division KSB1 bacterium]